MIGDRTHISLTNALTAITRGVRGAQAALSVGDEDMLRAQLDRIHHSIEHARRLTRPIPWAALDAEADHREGVNTYLSCPACGGAVPAQAVECGDCGATL